MGAPMVASLVGFVRMAVLYLKQAGDCAGSASIAAESFIRAIMRK
jgi:hypothetical protein